MPPGVETSSPTDPGARAVPPPIRSDPNPGWMRMALHAVYDGVWVLAIVGASPWWLWRCARDEEFRRMALARLTFGLPAAPRPDDRLRVLIHGVSVGEVKAAGPLVRLIEREHPDLEVVISTTTLTGHALARRLYPDQEVVRFPLDPSWLVRRFLRRLSPACVVLIELEIWPNFLRSANRLGIPVAVANGRITSESHRHYLSFRRLLPQFNRISLYCVQDERYARRFLQLSRDESRLVVTGNVKADALEVGLREAPEELARLLGGEEGRPVVVGGSTHEPEETLLAEAWREWIPQARLILVPRHPGRAEVVAKALAAAGGSPQLLTDLRAGRERPDPRRVAVVDTIGDLEGVYGLADLVFVGGSLVPHGGQNMLEPAAAGRATLYGPHVENFREEAELLERDGASVRLEGPEGLGATLRDLLGDEQRRARMSRTGMAAVASQTGASRRTLEALLERGLIPVAP
ncbi:MAG: 3-deoxy-D-manno-octulosonic acid transferase [Planctomycetota bacterium]|jgi:3-deoxy-D-manno-octulosonic-acid transferase|nr:3-deoxy-D-manno-octulosonic acid transferase [Planctomycetota bacterium]MDP6762412.1 3-deoxy-D-manno-octulosonic acid transferase [Planctomycetota bacterium]MDP6989548.1 3-deoxy-D-manno-octulosonic acid transferase [Planctomycetota bacterium]